MKISVIICAAGTGERFVGNYPLPKQYLPVNGKSIIEHSIDKFLASNLIENIVIAINPTHKPIIEEILQKYNHLSNIFTINGADSRLKSVQYALEYLSKQEITHVFIHDAVRPNFSINLIEQLINTAKESDGAIPIIRSTNTIKKFNNNSLQTLDRDTIIQSQTPQYFQFIKIYNSYKSLNIDDNEAQKITDDAQVAELAGIRLKILEDSPSNYKITDVSDYDRYRLESAETPRMTRVGIGFDVHRFGEGHNIRLFGVDIPYHKSLEGHSDADVGLHSLTDAIYGSISSEDIGFHFKPSDKRWKDADSTIFLNDSLDKLRNLGGKLINIDIVVICQEPNINKFRESIKEKLSILLAIDKNMIGLKATTTEKLGFTGRKEGIAVQTIVNILV